MTTYRVVVLGIKKGQDPEKVLQQLAAMFKQPVERLQSLLTGSRTVVKRGVDIAMAAKMQAAIESAGCEVVVEPEVSEVVASSQNSRSDLLVPQTASEPRHGVVSPANAKSADLASAAATTFRSDLNGRWSLFRAATRHFGWAHWVTAASVVILVIISVPILVISLSPMPFTGASAPSDKTTSSGVGKVVIAGYEEPARKFANEVCTGIEGFHSEVAAEGTMTDGDVGFNGRTLPAAIIKISGTCVNSLLGTREPYTFVAVAAVDKEFKVLRGTRNYVAIGNSAPLRGTVDQFISTYFRRN